MIDLKRLYKEHCKRYEVPFSEETSILSYDDSTLFCPAGMQKFKKQFKDDSYTGTIANIQPCLRLNDLDLLGDGTHFAYFDMMGLFSFREQPLSWAVDFWLSFINDILNLRLSKVTIHPDKISDWRRYYMCHVEQITPDSECIWSDGDIGGYCTEFYIHHNGQDVEIGNIVNPLGNSIDCGFGAERIKNIINNTIPKTKLELLEECILKIIDSGVAPSNKLHGYVLRKLLRSFIILGGYMDHKFWKEENDRQRIIEEKYFKLKHKHLDKSAAWWYDTHGIDLNLLRA